MSRTPEQEGERIGRMLLAAELGQLLKTARPHATVTVYETNTGLQQVRLEYRDGTAYHVTITRARK